VANSITRDGVPLTSSGFQYARFQCRSSPPSVGQGRVLASHKKIRRTLPDMAPIIERISAITLRVRNMKTSVQFYRNVLGMELLYGGEHSSFSSLRANDSESVILNLELGNGVSRWGRIIFHVTHVDVFWKLLKGED